MNDLDVRVLFVGSICGYGIVEFMVKFYVIFGEGGIW